MIKCALVKTWKQAPLAIHASSCSAPLGFSCSCFLAFRFPALVLLRSCIHGLHLDRNLGAAPYRVIGVDKCHLSRDSPCRISFATVTSCSSCVCLLLLALRSRFARWMSLASVTSRSDCVCLLSLYSLLDLRLGDSFLTSVTSRSDCVSLLLSACCGYLDSNVPLITCRFDS